MAKPKTDTVQVKFNLKREIYNILVEDSEKNGVSMNSYVSMLIAQKRIERQAMMFVSSMPTDVLLKLNDEAKKGGEE